MCRPDQESPCQRMPPPWSLSAGVPALPESWSVSPPTGRNSSTGPLDVHVVEPHERGLRADLALRAAPWPDAQFGRRGRHHVHRLLRAVRRPCRGRSRAGRVGRRCAGRLHHGRAGAAGGTRRQLQELSGATFPTRQLQSKYLEWFFRRAAAALGTGRHRHGPPGQRHSIESASAGSEPDAGAVPRAAGRRRSAAGRRRGHRPGAHRFAAGCGVRGAGPTSPPATAGFTRRPATPPTSTIHRSRPGQDVIVSGMGLAFVDLLVLLMEGRGGRFEETPDGGLRYLPSGAEPRIWAGSRRGVPYHSKISSHAARRTRRCPAVLHRGGRRGPAGGARRAGFPHPALAADRQGRRLRLLPRAVHRLSGAGQHGLDRVRRSASRAVDWYSPERVRLVAETVPDGELHLDLEQLDHPFAGRGVRRTDRGPGRGHGLHRERPPAAHRAGPLRDAGPLHGTAQGLHGAGPPGAGRSASTPARSRRSTAGGTGSSALSTPGRRRAGSARCSRCTAPGCCSSSAPGWRSPPTRNRAGSSPPRRSPVSRVHATALIEARLPAPSVARSANPLLRQLHRSGLGAEQQLLSAEGLHSTGRLLVSEHNELLSPVGERRPRLFGVGPGTSGWGAGAFAQARHECGAVPGKRRPGPAHPDRPGRAHGFPRQPEAAAEIGARHRQGKA